MALTKYEIKCWSKLGGNEILNVQARSCSLHNGGINNIYLSWTVDVSPSSSSLSSPSSTEVSELFSTFLLSQLGGNWTNIRPAEEWVIMVSQSESYVISYHMTGDMYAYTIVMRASKTMKWPAHDYQVTVTWFYAPVRSSPLRVSWSKAMSCFGTLLPVMSPSGSSGASLCSVSTLIPLLARSARLGPSVWEAGRLTPRIRPPLTLLAPTCIHGKTDMYSHGLGHSVIVCVRAIQWLPVYAVQLQRM